MFWADFQMETFEYKSNVVDQVLLQIFIIEIQIQLISILLQLISILAQLWDYNINMFVGCVYFVQ